MLLGILEDGNKICISFKNQMTKRQGKQLITYKKILSQFMFMQRSLSKNMTS